MFSFRKIFDTFRREPAQDYLLTTVGPPGPEIEPGRHYVHVTLLSSRIPLIRRWGSEYRGAVYSFCGLNDLVEGTSEYKQITTPKALVELDGDIGDRVIQVNKTLVDQAPYHGGLTIEAGLFSLKTRDLISEFLSVANSLSEKAGVAFPAAVTPFLPIIDEAANYLLGTGAESRLEIGIDAEFPIPDHAQPGAETPLRSGYYAAVKAPQGQLNPADLKLQEGDMKLLGRDGRPITDYPYMIIAIVGKSTRDNWMKDAELRKAWSEIGEAVKRGQINEAEDRLKAFEWICRSSPVLLPAHARAVAQQANERFGFVSSGGNISMEEREVADADNPLGALSAFTLE